MLTTISGRTTTPPHSRPLAVSCIPASMRPFFIASPMYSREKSRRSPPIQGPPGRHRCSSGARHLDPHHVLQHAVEATENRELVDLLGHLLQRLQLLHPKERRVLVHESRGVEQRAGRCRLLAAADQVRLSDLLRLDHLVEDGLHLTRQDYILDSDGTHCQSMLLDLRSHGVPDLTIECALVAEQLIERPDTHRFAQCELQF